jgi:hypothetical protein
MYKQEPITRGKFTAVCLEPCAVAGGIKKSVAKDGAAMASYSGVVFSREESPSGDSQGSPGVQSFFMLGAIPCWALLRKETHHEH